MNIWFESFSLFVPKFRFGIFNFGFGGSSDSAAFDEKTSSNVNKEKTDKTISVKDTVKTSSSDKRSSESADVSTEATQSLSLLDEQTQQILTDALQDLATEGFPLDVIQSLQERAITAPDELAGLVDPIVANARANLETQLGQSQQQLARSAGSSQNSLVQQLGLEQATEVERELASLAATLGIQTFDAATQTQVAAVEASTSPLAQLAEVLKGATQTGTSTEATQALTQLSELLSGRETGRENETDVSQILERLSAFEEASGTGSGRTRGGGFGIGLDIF